MSGKSVFLSLLAVVVVIGGVYLLNKEPQEAAAPTDNEQTQQESNDAVEPQAQTPQTDNTEPEPTREEEAARSVTVSATAAGYSPTVVVIKAGDSVIFKNETSELRWPASDPHPIHTGLAGFDPERALEPGESWIFKFTKSGSFGYHDHLKTNFRGSVTVE